MPGLCAASASSIWKPIVSTGLSEVIGSWKIIDSSPPRSLRSSDRFIFIRLLPLYQASPRTIRPWGIRPRIESMLTLFPEPDSPTTPRVSPG